MGRSKDAFGSEIQYIASKDQYLCTICAEINLLEGRPMKRGSVKDHLASSKHIQNVEAKAAKEQKENNQRSKYSRTYLTSSSVQLNSHFQAHVSSARRPNLRDFDIKSSIPHTDHLHVTPEELFLRPKSPCRDIIHDSDKFLSTQYQTLLHEALHLDEFGPEDDVEEDDLDGANSDACVEELEAENDGTDSDSGQYFPYPSKATMLLDILDNLPRLRLSSHSVQLIIWMMKELGVGGVPSFNSFRGLQSSLGKQFGLSPQGHVSDFHFFSINPQEWVAREFANPHVAPYINLYPERTDGPRSESWQFDCWTEYQANELTPMMTRGVRQFWIGEVAQLDNGLYVIPRNWIYVTTAGKRELCSDCSVVQVTSEGWATLPSKMTFKLSQFQYNFDDILARVGDSIPWHRDAEDISNMPNHLREIAGGDDLFVVMIPLWCDDVSGNKSKQYNKHVNIYSVNGSLPGQMLQQEYFVNFISTSPNATPLEQFKTLRDQLRETETNPIRCYNAHTSRMCRSILRVPYLPADNPAQAEEASHMGGNSNCPCCKCKIGGGYKATETPEGYHSFFCDTKSLCRSADEIKSELNVQLHAAMTGVESAVSKLQTASGTKDKITQYWIDELIVKAQNLKETTTLSQDAITKELEIWLDNQPGEKMNPLLDITGLDPSQDTPVEILHTILLGIVKYIWHMSNTAMSDKELELLAVRLQSTDTDGLTIPPIRAAYMVQYRNNLIGKHFKSLMQILPFHVHNFLKLGSAHFVLVRSVAALGALLWVYEIKDLETYLNDLDMLVGNVLDAFADVDPSKILVKIKIHLLAHLKEDVRRFGPPIRYATEVFEAYNAVFRLCSIYSNHQAPSRDILTQSSSMGRVKHLLSGGFFPKENSRGEVHWVQASQAVQNLLLQVPIIQRHLGWVPSTTVQAGKVSFKSLKKAQIIPWNSAKASGCISDTPPRTAQWLIGESPKVVSITGDFCSTGSWVFAKSKQSGMVIGRIVEILLQQGTSFGIVTLDQFELGSILHEDFQCPVLHRPTALRLVAVKSKDIQFRFSAQHDCRLGNCQPTRQIHVRQERQITERTQQLLTHVDDDNFVINMYALHNATVLRDALPRELWPKPIPLHENRQAKHYEVSQTLAVTQADKRARTQEKARATRARNKASAVVPDAGTNLGGDQPEPAEEDVQTSGKGNLESGNGSKKRRRA